MSVMPTPRPLLLSWAHQRDYALRLVGDLSDADMIAQPVPGVVMNHPAWILSHLLVYTELLGGIVRREPVEDPIDHPHGRKSSPLADAAAYLPRLTLIEKYTNAHDAVAVAVESADDGVWAEPLPFPRWARRWTCIAEAAVHIMVHHEAVHLGQLSAWRRAGGRSAV
ncbi:MAG: DinB family protein [Phycisphaerales bacterium]|nr:DinB family protein [Phycisphaerales bacterium]